MNADAIKTFTTDALDKLGALLDEGHSERLTALFKTMARFRKYSWHNVLLIAAQRPDATRVAGFQTWRSLGRFVRRGEKGIAILAPIVKRRTAETATPDTDVANSAVFGFRAVHVFDIAQTVALADEVVADKGCHSRAVVLDLNTHGFRTYISEPDRGDQSWTDQADARDAVYANRRRIRGDRGKRLLRRRGERVERSRRNVSSV